MVGTSRSWEYIGEQNVGVAFCTKGQCTPYAKATSNHRARYKAPDAALAMPSCFGEASEAEQIGPLTTTNRPQRRMPANRQHTLPSDNPWLCAKQNKLCLTTETGRGTKPPQLLQANTIFVYRASVCDIQLQPLFGRPMWSAKEGCL